MLIYSSRTRRHNSRLYTAAVNFVHAFVLLTAQTSLPLLTRPRIDIQPKHIRIQEYLIPAVLQNTCNVLCVLKFSQVNVTSALLDGLTNQLCGTSLTLGADNGGLLFLAGFVDHEGGALGFLLCDLLGFDGGGEFGGEGEMLMGC